MPAQHEQAARWAGQEGGDSAAAWDASGTVDGSAWDDLSVADPSAWGDGSTVVDGAGVDRADGDGAALDRVGVDGVDADGSGDVAERGAEASVWDDDRPVPSAWDDEVSQAWGEVPSASRAPTRRAAARSRSPRTPAAVSSSALGDGSPGLGVGTGAQRPAEPSAEPGGRPQREDDAAVTRAALAARTAEILARSAGDGGVGAGRARGASAERSAARATGGDETGADETGRQVSGGRRSGARGSGARDDDRAPTEVEDAEPAPRGRRSPAGTGARRPVRGRRRAPGQEPPEGGAAAADAEPDPESVARSIALRLLTGAPRSRAQLAEAMARKDVPEEVAERVLDRFTEVGLVDDVAYAEMLVRTRHAERGMSRRGIAQELRRRGVDDVTAREALGQVDDEDEERSARALARKKLAATRGLDRETRLRRAYGALGRKGYGGELVARVVREELAADGADTGD